MNEDLKNKVAELLYKEANWLKRLVSNFKKTPTLPPTGSPTPNLPISIKPKGAAEFPLGSPKNPVIVGAKQQSLPTSMFPKSISSNSINKPNHAPTTNPGTYNGLTSKPPLSSEILPTQSAPMSSNLRLLAQERGISPEALIDHLKMLGMVHGQ